MHVRAEVVPFLFVALAAGLAIAGAARLAGAGRRQTLIAGIAVGVMLAVYMLYFFRDPERTPPGDPEAVLAGADGTVARITTLAPDQFRRTATACGLDAGQTAAFMEHGDPVRISIFLSLLNVHVNRAPISGESRFLGYFPGQHVFTFKEKSSDVNQHNSILVSNPRTHCLINQIVGPVCRRVVYWPDHDRAVPLKAGDRIGMMKFGSRLDMIFPAADITPTVREGERVRAGETIIARLVPENET